MRIVSAFLFALLAIVAIRPAAAQDYPDRPINFIVGQTAGGGTDVFARLLVKYMQKYLGPESTIVVLNKPGASGELGFAEIAHSEPDGYTIGLLNIPNMLTQIITRTPPTFTLDSFSYLGKVYSGQASLVVPVNSKLHTVKDLVDRAKAHPGQMTLGIAGLGADDHLLALQFFKQVGIDMKIVPMGGAAEARNAVMGAQLDVGSMGLVDGYRFREHLRALGVMSAQRMAFAPDVATFREQGYDIVGGAIRIVAGPANLPEHVKNKLAKAVEQSAKDLEFIAEAEKMSSFVDYANPQDAEKFLRDDLKILRSLWASDPW